MEGIKSILSSVLKDMTRQRQGLDFEKAQSAWARAAGPQAVRHTKLVHLTKDKIQVNVDSSAWLYQLNLKKQSITKMLSKQLNIKELSFRLGDIREDNGRR